MNRSIKSLRKLTALATTGFCLFATSCIKEENNASFTFTNNSTSIILITYEGIEHPAYPIGSDLGIAPMPCEIGPMPTGSYNFTFEIADNDSIPVKSLTLDAPNSSNYAYKMSIVNNAIKVEECST